MTITTGTADTNTTKEPARRATSIAGSINVQTTRSRAGIAMGDHSPVPPTSSLVAQRTRSVNRTLAVDVSGPRDGHAVVMLNELGADNDFVESVRARLHIALLRTVVITSHQSPHPQELLDILRRVGVSWSLLVADRGLGPVAWKLAATHRDLFSGLIVVDCGHPRVADAAGMVIDPHCPPVLADTTALFSGNTEAAVAQASGRYVHGQFRLVNLARHVDHRVSQLACEIVLNAHSR